MSHHYDKPRAAAATAGAVGGKTARACDSCIRRRARWYCAADDAFLCEPCDSAVHSANLLARRHERLRLKASSSDGGGGGNYLAAPAWHNGFKRKARTPRPHQHAVKPVVPELETSAEDDAGEEAEDEEQLLYRVPIFDPALTFSSPPAARELKAAPQPTAAGAASCSDGIGIEFMSPSEVEMAEFSADMESLLGRGLDGGDVFCMEELGLMIDAGEGGGGAVEVKAEMEEAGRGCGGLNFEMEVDLSRETLDLDFDCGSSEAAEEMEDEEKPAGVVEEKERDSMRGVGLRLDYEAVMEAWSLRGGSPWTSGERPRLGPEEYWMECMGMWGGVGGEVVGGGIQVMDVGREARVTRYREKRRTRLFSKKIRYEVRKLNAEKRPRMKGRFVKRTSLAAAAGGCGGGGGGGGGMAFAY